MMKLFIVAIVIIILKSLIYLYIENDETFYCSYCNYYIKKFNLFIYRK